MVIAADSAGIADAIGPSPSGSSLRGLEPSTCFSPEHWRASAPRRRIPRRAEMDATRHRFCADSSWVRWIAESTPRRSIARRNPIEANRGRAGCLYGCSRRADHCRLADYPAGVDRSDAPRHHRRLPGAGGCSHQPRPGRLRRARRTTRPQSALRLIGSGGCGWSHGPHCLFPVVSRDIFRRCRAGAAAARCARPHPAFRYPFWPRLVPPESPRAERTAESTAPEPFEKPRPAHIRRRRCCHSPARRSGTARRLFPRSSFQR
jgi:hypothetical protein